MVEKQGATAAAALLYQKGWDSRIAQDRALRRQHSYVWRGFDKCGEITPHIRQTGTLDP
jgi:hypothetical protein